MEALEAVLTAAARAAMKDLMDLLLAVDLAEQKADVLDRQMDERSAAWSVAGMVVRKADSMVK
jgi:hypothetical protein